MFILRQRRVGIYSSNLPFWRHAVDNSKKHPTCDIGQQMHWQISKLSTVSLHRWRPIYNLMTSSLFSVFVSGSTSIVCFPLYIPLDILTISIKVSFHWRVFELLTVVLAVPSHGIAITSLLVRLHSQDWNFIDVGNLILIVCTDVAELFSAIDKGRWKNYVPWRWECCHGQWYVNAQNVSPLHFDFYVLSVLACLKNNWFNLFVVSERFHHN